jgi:hypothetical protein
MQMIRLKHMPCLGADQAQAKKSPEAVGRSGQWVSIRAVAALFYCVDSSGFDNN